MPADPIRVLIVDDSPLMRELLSHLLASDPDIVVAGTAADPAEARSEIKRLNPDVVTLDVEMPGMNGIAFLEKIMTLRPMPVVMISTLTQAGAGASIRALEIGAVEVVGKPVDSRGRGIEMARTEIIEKVKAAAAARVRPKQPAQPSPAGHGTMSGRRRQGGVIAIGASTGGVEALGHILTALPDDLPPILIVQHMPPQFTRSLAERLDGLCQLHVKEAEDGDGLEPGTAYIGPGGRQFTLGRHAGRRCCRLGGEERVSGHCPSVDVLFRSVAHEAGADALGVLLTGMGRDGARGLLDMRLAGARTIGQDEATSVVYGMPKAAFEIGAVALQLPLQRIATTIAELFAAASAPEIR